jgi:hypothetical protein
MTTESNAEDGTARKPPAARVARCWLFRVGRAILIAYLTYAGVLYFLQTAMLFPGRDTQGTAAAVVRGLPLGGELITVKAASGQPVALAYGSALDANGVPMPDARRRPTLIYFYGNAMCLRDAVGQFGDFRRLGMNVCIPEFLGFGMSGGDASEQGCYETADAAYDYVIGRGDVHPDRIIAGGWSLGGAVAIDLASRRKVAALISFCTFTSVADMGRRLYPFLPMSMLVKHRFENEAKIAGVTCPTLIGHGRADSIIPFEMSDRLAAAAGGPVARLAPSRADHNDFFDVAWGEIAPAMCALAEQVQQSAVQ